MTVTPAAYGGDDDVPVDGFGDVGRLVAHRVADLLHGYAVVAHDRHCGVPGFVGVPVAEAGTAGDLGESPVEVVAGSEPGGADRQALPGVRRHLRRHRQAPREEDRHHRDRRKLLTRACHLLAGQATGTPGMTTPHTSRAA